ncbi:hypothetical protein EZV62_006225 [Acer yangbiense]|uniref:Protein kinase domain-containing protein n=1 Tax=Acer yangbiense TaxID=1000413 RepID=A0A5C7IPT8_9ROSI|nr:hypothetical protein EZV62_006225 [Acer yangbiense]
MWAMGAIMAELFMFKPLFPGRNSSDQMLKICGVLGIPTAASWLGGLALAGGLNYQFPQLPGVNLSSLMPLAISGNAISLIKSLCSWDPSKRPPSASEALTHPFFHTCYKLQHSTISFSQSECQFQSKQCGSDWFGSSSKTVSLVKSDGSGSEAILGQLGHTCKLSFILAFMFLLSPVSPCREFISRPRNYIFLTKSVVTNFWSIQRIGISFLQFFSRILSESLCSHSTKINNFLPNSLRFLRVFSRDQLGITIGIRANILQPVAMVEGTRNQVVESRLTDLDSRNQVMEGRVLNIEEKLQQIGGGVNTCKSEIEGMASKIAQLHDLVYRSFNRVEPEEGNGKGILGSAPAGSSSNSPLGTSRQTGHHPPATKVFTDNQFKPPKLNFPKFDGTDPKAWIRKCERFFLIYPVEPEKKVIVASIHFEKKAETWFQTFYALKGNIGWEEFTDSLLVRFLDLEQEDVVGEFQRLKQTSTVTNFQDRFEELQPRLISKNLGLSDEFFLACFVSGLKGEIRNSVKMFHPPDLKSAIHLARLQEAAIEAKKFKPWPNKPTPNTTPNSHPAVTRWSPTLNQHQPPSQTQKKPETYPIKRLTPTEMKARRDKGLCYNCDEVYSFGHQCAKRHIYMLIGEEGSEEEEEEGTEGNSVKVDILTELPGEEITISHQALNGGSKGIQTIKLKGTVKNREITILVDSGFTHNFLDPETAKFTGIKIESTNLLWVTVGGGGKISSQARCLAFTWTVQGTSFTTEMRLLKLGGCDAVLGMQWLQEIGPVLLDAKLLTMGFKQGQHWITLQGVMEDGGRLLHLEGRRVASHFSKA